MSGKPAPNEGHPCDDSRPKGAKLHPEQHMVHARGLQLCLTHWHSGETGRPLLFLNGIGADAGTAAPLLRRITGREVWTIDMPGTGKSPDCFWPYSAQSMAAAIIDVAKQRDVTSLDLMGFSWGGTLAQQITGQFPDHINRLILMATITHMSAADIGWGAIWDRDIVATGLSALPTSSPLGLTYQSLAMAGWSNQPLRADIARHAVLVISGQQDQIISSRHGERLAEQLQAKRHLILSGGHLFPFTKAKETAAEINHFLSET